MTTLLVFHLQTAVACRLTFSLVWHRMRSIHGNQFPISLETHSRRCCCFRIMELQTRPTIGDSSATDSLQLRSITLTHCPEFHSMVTIGILILGISMTDLGGLLGAMHRLKAILVVLYRALQNSASYKVLRRSQDNQSLKCSLQPSLESTTWSSMATAFPSHPQGFWCHLQEPFGWQGSAAAERPRKGLINSATHHDDEIEIAPCLVQERCTTVSVVALWGYDRDGHATGFTARGFFRAVARINQTFLTRPSLIDSNIPVALRVCGPSR